MDSDARELERQYRENPQDAGVRAAYEAALRRSQDSEGLTKLYALSFACPMQWHQLEETEAPLVRRCSGCQEDVHLALTDEAFEEHTAAGRCVAVLDQHLEERSQQAAAALAADAERPASACMAEGTWFDLLLDAMAARPGAMSLGQGAAIAPPEESELARASGERSYVGALRRAHELRSERDAKQVPQVGPLARLRRWLGRR